MESARPQRISPEDLAAGIYPEGDIRNKPHVRKWMEECQASEAKRKAEGPARRESYEQRLERLYWWDTVKALEKRLQRGTYGDAYVISGETKEKLQEALQALRGEVREWFP